MSGRELQTLNRIEAIRQAASEVGDCDTSILCNLAMYAETDKARRWARRQLAART